MRRFTRAILLSMGLLVAASPGPAPAAETVTIGTKVTPPFVYRGESGEWKGISIELWSGIAGRLGLETEFVEMPLPEMLDATARGELDAALAAVTVTADREARLDFSHPFYSSGLGIAAAVDSSPLWRRGVEALLSGAFARAVLALGLVLLAVGVAVWWLERRRNPGQFGGTAAQGIGSGFWWSAVTMTTVGYGDKAPATAGGRLVALVWMFASLILVSGFTAAIASALTLSGLESAIRGPQDLPHVRVGSVAGTTSADFLQRRGISFTPYESPREALAALAGGGLDAVVYDKPILQYLARTEMGSDVQTLPHTLDQQQYAIALPEGSPLREEMNRALLEVIDQPAWRETLAAHFGE